MLKAAATVVRVESGHAVLGLAVYRWMAGALAVDLALALLFLPALGALSVGQYDFPVLLGTSLLTIPCEKNMHLDGVWHPVADLQAPHRRADPGICAGLLDCIQK